MDNNHFPKVICQLLCPQRHNEMLYITCKGPVHRSYFQPQLKLKYWTIMLEKITRKIHLEHQKEKENIKILCFGKCRFN